ncbi:MAG: putative 4-hydroxybenzoate polyprenyltransferase [Planctomycetota bacterium]|nr:putative 4-hydroxybenzoate polyprenyltransferase [Planctomycetota bacterium]MDA1247905.1 putative 4-hydroxybenzoate polyprenyltransferase [Planctomycetota bacterium]
MADATSPAPTQNEAAPAGVTTRVRHILELIRFSHTIFALPFALLSAALAWFHPGSFFRWLDLAGILLCMIFARSAAMAFNRLVDRDIDAANPRTEKRHIPAGLLSAKAVAVFTFFCSAAFVASTLIFLPKRLPIILAVPVLLFLLGYSYAKRFTSLCHYWLSAALMLSPIAAWIAVRDEFALPPTLLAAVVFFWVGGFDIIYACQDTDFDKGKRLHSVPARFGIPAALRIAMVSHLLTIVSLVGLWYLTDLGTIFLVGVLLVSGLLIYEHSLVRPDNLAKVNIAFFNVNALISFGLFLAGLIDLWTSTLIPTFVGPENPLF